MIEKKEVMKVMKKFMRNIERKNQKNIFILKKNHKRKNIVIKEGIYMKMRKKRIVLIRKKEKLNIFILKKIVMEMNIQMKKYFHQVKNKKKENQK